MGSSPSYEGSEVFQSKQPMINRRKASNLKGSQRMALQEPKIGQLEENPEQHNAVNEAKPSQRASATIKENKNQQILIPNNQLAVQQPNATDKVDYEQMARSNIPKKLVSHHNSQQEEQEQHQTPKRKPIRQADQHQRGKIYNTNRNAINEEQHESIHERNHRRLLKDKEHRQQFNQTPFQHQDPSHKRNIIYRPHKNGEIDYHQYDSAHIRHKAIQQIHEVEHKKPIIQREAIYEHEKLYPKILKDNHQEPINSKRVNSKTKHTQHQRRITEQQKIEQLRKINLYRKHKMHVIGSSNDNYDETEEPQPHSHPTLKNYHKEENELQKSMKIRTGRNNHHQNLQPSVYARAREQFHKVRNQRNGNLQHSQDLIEQNRPKANFLKRKTNKYNDELKNEQAIKEIQARNKQLQEKSIAQIKKENDFDVTQYEVNPQQLKTCRECGRKFHQSRIQKHEKICQRLVEEKREQFHAQDQRIVSKEQKKFIKRGKVSQQKIIQTKKDEKISKWKAQSIALRAHIKMGKDPNYVPDSDQMEMLSQQNHIDVVNCQFCGRNFNKNSAKTHIPFCQGKYEKQLEKQKFQRHPKNKR